jgi:DNA-binding MarR family transcriptional regulator
MTTARSVRRAYDKCLSAANVNPTEASIIAHLADSGPHTQIQIARLTTTNRVQIGLNIDSLVDKRFVLRRADPRDRRVWLIHLTPAGAQLSHQIAVLDEAVRRRLQASTTIAERSVVDRVLAQIQRNAVDLEASPLVAEVPPPRPHRAAS